MVAGPPEAGSAIARTTAATRVTTVSTQSAQASALSLLLTANLRSPDPVIAHPVSIARPSSANSVRYPLRNFPEGGYRDGRGGGDHAAGAAAGDALCELLWPNHDLDRARGALRRTLSTLRRAIGEERLDTTADSVALVPA